MKHGKGVLAALAAALLMAASSGCIYVSGLGIGSDRLQETVAQRSQRLFEGNKILICDLEGFIGGRGLFSFGGANPNDLREKLDRAAQDPAVRAVVLRVDSPGGEVTATDVIYHELLAFRRRAGKPIVACIMGVGASGGYYAALAADRIVCHPTAVTGSVGVIMSYTNIEGLFQLLGLKAAAIRSGDHKDIGSPLRPMTAEERGMLQAINDDLFQQFLGLVRTRRPGVTAADLAVIRDGRIFTARQALDVHLVDRVGYLDDALAEAKRLAGIPDADVVLYRRYPRGGGSIYASAEAQGGGVEALVAQGLRLFGQARGPGYLYLWQPGAAGE